MKKVLVIGIVLLILSACLYSKKLDHPLMDNPAFEIIGDQGYKQDISLDELQGDYECNLWILDDQDNPVSANKIACDAMIVENELSIEWTLEAMDYTFTSPPFKLEQGLVYSEEEEPLLISAVKVYPDGHMVDGVGTLVLEQTKIRFHFQMIQ